MTRFKIQRMKFFIFLSIFLLGQIAVCSGTFRERSVGREVSLTKSVINGEVLSSSIEKKQYNEAPSSSLPSSSSSLTKVIDDGNMGGNEKPPTNITSKSFVEVSNGTIQTTTLTSKEHITEGHLTSLNSGALLRGFCVFIGLSILVMAYIVFRSFRFSRTRAQMIRKYGILAHRQDVEMRPLPLEEEDDEDTTVFDASNVLTNNVQHQNL
ncbi:membrane protein FAM174-like [Vespula squamosa]|uniref:Membrane protein FAM174-like n=1 Tax=Vespula squamosa TaxID=30214 RepID=A0ABD2BSD8_VESSQ